MWSLASLFNPGIIYSQMNEKNVLKCMSRCYVRDEGIVCNPGYIHVNRNLKRIVNCSESIVPLHDTLFIQNIHYAVITDNW